MRHVDDDCCFDKSESLRETSTRSQGNLQTSTAQFKSHRGTDSEILANHNASIFKTPTPPLRRSRRALAQDRVLTGSPADIKHPASRPQPVRSPCWQHEKLIRPTRFHTFHSDQITARKQDFEAGSESCRVVSSWPLQARGFEPSYVSRPCLSQTSQPNYRDSPARKTRSSPPALSSHSFCTISRVPWSNQQRRTCHQICLSETPNLLG
ncbi:MAG: hypothetical protein ACI91F_002993 [Candidatus Binatia bacterium]